MDRGYKTDHQEHLMCLIIPKISVLSLHLSMRLPGDDGNINWISLDLGQIVRKNITYKSKAIPLAFGKLYSYFSLYLDFLLLLFTKDI